MKFARGKFRGRGWRETFEIGENKVTARWLNHPTGLNADSGLRDARGDPVYATTKRAGVASSGSQFARNGGVCGHSHPMMPQ